MIIAIHAKFIPLYLVKKQNETPSSFVYVIEVFDIIGFIFFNFLIEDIFVIWWKDSLMFYVSDAMCSIDLCKETEWKLPFQIFGSVDWSRLYINWMLIILSDELEVDLSIVLPLPLPWGFGVFFRADILLHIYCFLLVKSLSIAFLANSPTLVSSL